MTACLTLPQNNEWKSKLQEEDHERQKHAAEKLKEALKRQVRCLKACF